MKSIGMKKDQSDMISARDENGQSLDSALHEVANQLAAVQTQIKTATNQRPPCYGAEPVTLVAVSKRQPNVKIDAVLAAGQRVSAKTAFKKLTALGRPANGIQRFDLHLIGPLQTNKVAEAVALFDVIEIVDREKLASVLAKEMSRQNRYLDCYIQVNTGAEPQKSGILPDELDLPIFAKMSWHFPS